MRSAVYISVGLIVLAFAALGFRGGEVPTSVESSYWIANELAQAPAPAGEPASDPAPVPRPTPPVPLRVALQAGHWKAAEAPQELAGLRDNGGTRGGGKYEWEINLEIARLTGALLEEAGYEVEILPATVPERYRADLFIAIHADGHNDPSIRGYRVASPRRDATQRASEFAEVLADSYGEATGIRRIPIPTRRMRGYYAFRYNRYRHAIHPMTVGVIIETGFLTSPADRRIIVEDQGRAARGIFEGVREFLGSPTALGPAAATAPAD